MKKEKDADQRLEKIKDLDLKEMLSKLPQELDGILNLEQHWNEG